MYRGVLPLAAPPVREWRSVTTDKTTEPATGAFDAVPDRGTFRALSPNTLAAKVRARLWSTRRSMLVVRELAQHPSAGRAPTPGIDVSFVHPSTFPDLSSLLDDPRDEDLLSLAALERTRAEAAGELVVARAGNEVAAIHFIHTAADQERLDRIAPGLYAPLAAGDALTEGVFVFPPFRGRGVAASMLRASASELQRRGYRRGLAVIDVENRASLRAFRAAGFTARPVMRVDAYRLGRRTSRFVEVDPETWRRYEAATA
jgi:GNAT superfamily N-acetyltransferase